MLWSSLFDELLYVKCSRRRVIKTKRTSRFPEDGAAAKIGTLQVKDKKVHVRMYRSSSACIDFCFSMHRSSSHDCRHSFKSSDDPRLHAVFHSRQDLEWMDVCTRVCIVRLLILMYAVVLQLATAIPVRGRIV